MRHLTCFVSHTIESCFSNTPFWKASPRFTKREQPPKRAVKTIQPIMAHKSKTINACCNFSLSGSNISFYLFLAVIPVGARGAAVQMKPPVVHDDAALLKYRDLQCNFVHFQYGQAFNLRYVHRPTSVFGKVLAVLSNGQSGAFTFTLMVRPASASAIRGDRRVLLPLLGHQIAELL